MSTPLRACRRALPALAFAAATAAAAQSPETVSDFATAPVGGHFTFASSTPATLAELMQRAHPRPPTMVTGQLVLPKAVAGSAAVPAVVLVPGSGGVYPELVSFWAQRFGDAGIASFVLDVFGPRGVRSTVEDQGQVPFAADTADAFAALGLLATHPRIDAERIAVVGFSRGGVTAVRSAAVRVVEGAAAVPGQRFAAHVAVYSGGCAGPLSVWPRAGTFGTAPLLFVHGEADDYAYASDCRDYAERLRTAGVPAEFVLLPGARHKFDAGDPRRVTLRNAVKTREGCPLSLDLQPPATLRDRRNGLAVTGDAAQTIQRELCSDRGATVEGDAAAREAGGKAVTAFLTQALARR